MANRRGGTSSHGTKTTRLRGRRAGHGLGWPLWARDEGKQYIARSEYIGTGHGEASSQDRISPGTDKSSTAGVTQTSAYVGLRSLPASRSFVRFRRIKSKKRHRMCRGWTTAGRLLLQEAERDTVAALATVGGEQWFFSFSFLILFSFLVSPFLLLFLLCFSLSVFLSLFSLFSLFFLPAFMFPLTSSSLYYSSLAFQKTLRHAVGLAQLPKKNSLSACNRDELVSMPMDAPQQAAGRGCAREAAALPRR